jgi:hypothetical protein
MGIPWSQLRHQITEDELLEYVAYWSLEAREQRNARKPGKG